MAVGFGGSFPILQKFTDFVYLLLYLLLLRLEHFGQLVAPIHPALVVYF